MSNMFVLVLMQEVVVIEVVLQIMILFALEDGHGLQYVEVCCCTMQCLCCLHMHCDSASRMHDDVCCT